MQETLEMFAAYGQTEIETPFTNSKILNNNLLKF